MQCHLLFLILQTPLHLAIKLAFLPAIQMLLEEGSDPNLVDSTGSTSIHMAVQGRDSDCLEALLQWSKFECDLNYRNFEGKVMQVCFDLFFF